MTRTTRGIDHVGITVPDLEAATRFFTDALDAHVLYDTIDTPLSGPDIEAALGLPSGTELTRVRMLRLGEGPSIELFEYSTSQQGPPVRACDLGIQHFALYVDDIHQTAKRITEAGATLLGDPAPLPGAEEGDGNMWCYTTLPWGGLMELVTTPSPQAWETPDTLPRWHPSPENTQ